MKLVFSSVLFAWFGIWVLPLSWAVGFSWPRSAAER